MKTQFELHTIQGLILRELLFKPEAKFSELNIRDLSSDHFTFHISKLVEAELVEKTATNKYTLTTKGKECANRLDTDNAQIERQPKSAISAICVRSRNNKTEYLIQKRLKQPYYGYHGVVTGKIRWGETLGETVARELMEETGLVGESTLKGIKHKMDYDESGKLLEDKIFFIHRIDKCSGKLVSKFEGGENLWCSLEEIKNLPDIFPDLLLGIQVIEKPTLQFFEAKYTVSKY